MFALGSLYNFTLDFWTSLTLPNQLNLIGICFIYIHVWIILIFFHAKPTLWILTGILAIAPIIVCVVVEIWKDTFFKYQQWIKWLEFSFFSLVFTLDSLVTLLALSCFQWLPKVVANPNRVWSRNMYKRNKALHLHTRHHSIAGYPTSYTFDPWGLQNTSLSKPREWATSTNIAQQKYHCRPSSFGAPWENSNAFIVTAHNSSQQLPKTLKALLNVVKPFQIFVVDNGSTLREAFLTRSLCTSLSNEYRRKNPGYNEDSITYGYIKESSKTVAQFSVAYSLHFAKIYNFQFVTQIQDDVCISEEWNEKDIYWLFQNNPKVKALTYPVIPADTETMAQLFQDLESKLNGLMNNAKSQLTTVLYPSRIITTWDLKIFIEVLMRHDTQHIGENVQQGFLLNKLPGTNMSFTSEWKHECGYRIVLAPFVVKYNAPYHFVHYYDIVPCHLSGCWCNQSSVFSQKLQYNMTQYLFQFIQMIVHIKGFSYWEPLFVKILCLWELLFLLIDWIYLMIIIYSVFHPTMIISVGVVAMCVHLVVYDLFCLRKHRVDMSVWFWYLPLYQLPLFIVRLLAVFYNVYHYCYSRKTSTIQTRILLGDLEMVNNIQNSIPMEEGSEDDSNSIYSSTVNITGSLFTTSSDSSF